MRNKYFIGALVSCLALAAIVVGVQMLGGDQSAGAGLGLVTAMAVVQSTYGERIPAAVAGMIADMSSWDADSRVVETAAGIGFGIACSQGVADRGVVIGSSAANKFVGVSVRDVTLMPTATVVDKYPQYSIAALLYRGDIWATVGADVVAGQDVTFVSTTGVLSSTGADGTHFTIAGARWLDTQTSGGLARLRLSGALPSA